MVGGQLVHSQTTNIAEWPEDGRVRVTPGKAIELGKVERFEEGFNDGAEVVVEWTVIRRSDSKMAHLVKDLVGELSINGIGDPCQLSTFSSLAVAQEHDEASMPEQRPWCFPYIEAPLHCEKGDVFLTELAIRFCPDGPESDAGAEYASRDWNWVQAVLQDQVWR